jgi:hypothetical protein
MCHLRQGCIPYPVKETEMAEVGTTFILDSRLPGIFGVKSVDFLVYGD